ncbi:hypothetical protein [Azotobacter beijerinckii]|uniref:Uncharacterized protein n=1 Tax=Azotobacter beijerinckii TaxID=170623 RepID=A0A1I3ZP19_9GAMM|nr:hypothetical protein [Azotobacter beijerinckii]SFK45842.1 hypothetical protein SAMN04244574_00691 [Azotobacter beijerinckii]
MIDRPIESCYVNIATSLQRPGADFGIAKVLCLGLARQVDSLLSALSYSNRLAESHYDQITRLRAEKNRLREQLAELQRLADQRGNAVAGLLVQQSSAAQEKAR